MSQNIRQKYIWNLPKIDTPAGLEECRIWLINAMMLFVVITFPISMLSSGIIFFQKGMYFLIGIDAILYLVVSIAFFFKKGSMPIVPYIWLLLVYIMLIIFFALLGPHYARSAWLVMAAVMAALFFGSRGAIFTTILNIIILMTLYFSIDATNPAWANVFIEPFAKWLMFVVNVSSITLISAFPVGFLLKRLDISLKHEKNVIRALQESEEKFRLAFHTSPDSINLNRLENGTYLEINQGFTQMMGYSREEIIGKTSVELNIWENDDERKRLVKDLKEKGYVENMEAEFVGKDGCIRDALMSARILVINNEKVIISITRDNTKRKREEKILKRSENELRSIFRAAPTGIGVICDRIFQRVNDRFCEIVGYSKNELIGKNARIVYPTDEEFQRVGNEKYVQIQNENTGTIETIFRSKDGKIINVLLSSTPIDLNDLSQGVIFTALDITVSKSNEEKLLDSEEKYRTMMEAQEDATYISSPDMRIEYMNPAMIQWLGKDATGSVCYEAIWGAKVECTWCPQNKVMKGKAVTIETDVPNSNQIYQVSSAPIHHINGSISKLTSYRNITDIRQLHSRLEQAQKMESIGNLAGGIAHDFNNILFPIIGLSEMLAEDLPLNSPENENAKEIMKAGKRGSELVKQILAFSRKHEHKMIPVRVQEVLKEVLKLSRSSIPMNIEINHHLQQDCGLVRADVTQLHQIGMNLITNAYHAVQNSGGYIYVEVQEIILNDEFNDLALSPGVYAMLAVSDNGIGISKAHLDKIFEPYFTTKEKGKGTGLGLSVVYGIVKEHKGDIKVMSEPGKGTSFQVYLPLMKSSDVAQPISDKAAVETGTESILLVDDELPIVNLERQMLERLGYTVSIRTSSVDALDAFKANPDVYDLVITDMSMPQMTGDQFAIEILRTRPDIPVIICTGFSELIDEVAAKVIGIKGFIMKPVAKVKLAKEVRRVLDKTRALPAGGK